MIKTNVQRLIVCIQIEILHINRIKHLLSLSVLLVVVVVVGEHISKETRDMFDISFPGLLFLSTAELFAGLFNRTSNELRIVRTLPQSIKFFLLYKNLSMILVYYVIFILTMIPSVVILSLESFLIQGALVNSFSSMPFMLIVGNYLSTKESREGIAFFLPFDQFIVFFLVLLFSLLPYLVTRYWLHEILVPIAAALVGFVIVPMSFQWLEARITRSIY